MSTELQKPNQQITAKSLFAQPNVKGKFDELLGKRSTAFMTSVLQIVSQNDLLSKAEPQSVFHAAAVAATLDLPLNSNLGFAYIVPYNQSYKDNSGQWQKKQVAQFQMGYKGFIQLAQRSGQFKTISASAIYEGQLVSENPLTGFEFDFTKPSTGKVLGYASYFKLLNGFEKTLYMSVESLTKHGKKFSQTFKKDSGLWKDDFEGMATKTVIKLLLSKFAPLSVEMQQAVVLDQAIIQDANGEKFTYDDHEEIVIDKEAERLNLMIGDCKTVEEVEELQIGWPDFPVEIFEARKEELRNAIK
jgi:recombination protein RecT